MNQQQSESFLQSFQEEEPKAVKELLETLLEAQLKQLEKYLKSDQEATEILNLVKHCNTSGQLAELNITLFDHLFNKIEHKMQKYKQKSQIKLLSHKKNKSLEENIVVETNYDKLEKQVQKYEAEIRNHISVEQQLKIYAESLQSQVSSNIPSQMENERKPEPVKKDSKSLSMLVKNLKTQISEMKQKISAQQTLISIFQEKERNQKQLLGNYEKFDNIIKSQQKQKIQNIHNFKNYNIYNLKQDHSTNSNEWNKGKRASGTSNKVTEKLEKQRNSSARSLNFKQNTLDNKSDKQSENLKKKYKTMVANKHKLHSQDMSYANKNLKREILANLKMLRKG